MKPVSKTAYYCCAVRALDARTASPVCGDSFAVLFMTPDAWETFEPFRTLAPPNASNVARHRMIDDIIRTELARRPETGVVILGAGFDTRAFRLSGQHAQILELVPDKADGASGAGRGLQFRWRLSATSGIPRQQWDADGATLPTDPSEGPTP
jgi:hypothetical protein